MKIIKCLLLLVSIVLILTMLPAVGGTNQVIGTFSEVPSSPTPTTPVAIGWMQWIVLILSSVLSFLVQLFGDRE
jgi:TRAP-type C4-dicarboxylate transport system permease small subunit